MEFVKTPGVLRATYTVIWHEPLAAIVPPVHVMVEELVAAVKVPPEHAVFLVAAVELPLVLTFVMNMPLGRLSVMLKSVSDVSLGATMVMRKRVLAEPLETFAAVPNADTEVGLNDLETVAPGEAVIPIAAEALENDAAGEEAKIPDEIELV